MQDDVVPIEWSELSQEQRADLTAQVHRYEKSKAETAALEEEFETLAPDAARALADRDRHGWSLGSNHRLMLLRELVGVARKSKGSTQVATLVEELRRTVCPLRTMDDVRRGSELEAAITAATPINPADAAAVAAATCRGPLGNIEGGHPNESAWALIWEAVHGVARCLEACTGVCWPLWSPTTVSRSSGIIVALAEELTHKQAALRAGHQIEDDEVREDELDRLYREGVAIERAILNLPPCSIADCAIVLKVSASLFEALTVSDELAADLVTVRRAMASVIKVLDVAVGPAAWSPSGPSMILSARA